MLGRMRWLRSAMWGSAALIGWTHAGYPLAAALAARRVPVRSRATDDRAEGRLPSVTLIIAAHDEERVIAERLDNALALDYPRGRLEVVLSLDGSTDATKAIAERHAAAAGAGEVLRVLEQPRAGKVAAQNAAVRATSSDIVAFSDANSMWAPDALRRLVAHFDDPDVGYVCGRLRLVDPASGANLEGLYWRYELWLRAQESRLDSITAGNGAIYAVRRSAYIELAPGHSHDIALPFRLRRRGLRSLYDPEAVATEPAAASTSAEWDRKVRMLSRSWHDTLRGGMLDPRGMPPVYVVALISHRLLRYATGPLHVLVLIAAALLAPGARDGRALLAAHGLWAALALAGRRAAGGRAAALAWYYTVVTGASLAGLARLLRSGPQATWAAAEGTR
jgi:cellulose synthase/poly-beta-1,6-N-acetylglucosamine synthase-like glycosyltransferase